MATHVTKRLLVLCLAFVLLLVGCNSFGGETTQRNPAPGGKVSPGKLVFYYYEGEAGLPVQPGYEKYTLTTTDTPDKLRLDVFFRPSGDDEEETKSSYLVPAQALEDAMAAVKKNNMEDWNKRQYPAPCGYRYSCSFLWGDEWVGFSSDNMPEDGQRAFFEVRAAVSAYINQKSKLDATATP